MSRYTRSVFGAEAQIVASANHIVMGRRGAGKSMLLLYAMHEREIEGRASVWVDMQVYSRRDDIGVASDVFRDILEQTRNLLQEEEEHSRLIHDLQKPDLDEGGIRRLLPNIRRLLSRFAAQGKELFIFLDDFHVVSVNLQPIVLDILYATSRGNQTFLKISAIETLTRTFNPNTNQGLQVPQDAQMIKLDYNLTTPDKASQHIESILNSHAQYAGLPSVRRLCSSSDVIPRLTWVAAGVPRDALSLFSQAITKAIRDSRKRVTVSNVNAAASESVSTKLQELSTDASEKAEKLQALLQNIREFCVSEKQKNAFLVEIKPNDPTFEDILNLVHLRLLHVISEGITIGEVGRKYLGLILDYGFYTGIRAARSVELFNHHSGKIAYKDLRSLPVFGA